MAVAAAVAGGVAGGAALALVVYFATGGRGYWSAREGWNAFWMGALYGAATAIFWWLRYRRVLIRREAAVVENVVQG